jgi:hypothetical protein
MAGKPTNTNPDRLTLAIFVAAAVAVVVIKQTYVGEARWWNLFVAALLLGLLAAYLRAARK